MAFIGAVALIVIGPERLPGVARTTGQWVGKGRRMLNEVKSDIKREVREQELQELKDLKQELGSAASDFKKAADNPDVLGLKEAGEEVKKSVDDVSTGLEQAGDEVKPVKKAAKKKTTPGKAAAKKAPTKKSTARKTGATHKTPEQTSVEEVVKSEQTKSAKIRQLWEQGYSRGDIAQHLEISYQHVRGVLVGSKGLVRPADDGIRKVKKAK